MAAEPRAAFAIRRAELRDVQAIRAIDRQVYPKPWSEKLTVEQIARSKGRHFVAESNRVVGHAGMMFVADDAHISTIAVDPNYQRLGIATMLVDTLIECAATSIAGAITLEVRVGNDAAVSLYERLGFVSAGVRPRYYGDTGEDALIMWRGLDGEREQPQPG